MLCARPDLTLLASLFAIAACGSDGATATDDTVEADDTPSGVDIDTTPDHEVDTSLPDPDVEVCESDACVVTCEEDGVTYQVGDVISRDSGALECFCTEDGDWQCVAVDGCMIGGPPGWVPIGKAAPAIATFLPDRRDDRCNTCTCTPSFGWECTDHDCPNICINGSVWASHNDVYLPGESFFLDDKEETTCTCVAPGCESWVTTDPCSIASPGCTVFNQTGPRCGEIDCVSEPKTCTYEGADYYLTGVFAGADGCDVCRCDGEDAYTCEERECAAECEPGSACDPACNRFFAFTSSLDCEVGGGVQCPEGQVAFFDPACGCGCEPAP